MVTDHSPEVCSLCSSNRLLRASLKSGLGCGSASAFSFMSYANGQTIVPRAALGFLVTGFQRSFSILLWKI